MISVHPSSIACIRHVEVHRTPIAGQISDVFVMFVSGRPFMLKDFHLLAFLGLSTGSFPLWISMNSSTNMSLSCDRTSHSFCSSHRMLSWWSPCLCPSPCHLPLSPVVPFSRPLPGPLQSSIPITFFATVLVHLTSFGTCSFAVLALRASANVLRAGSEFCQFVVAPLRGVRSLRHPGEDAALDVIG